MDAFFLGRGMPVMAEAGWVGQREVTVATCGCQVFKEPEPGNSREVAQKVHTPLALCIFIVRLIVVGIPGVER